MTSKRWIIFNSVLVAIVIAIAVALYLSWMNDGFFIRVPNAHVTLNGEESPTSKLYKSGRGTYLLVTGRHDTYQHVYVFGTFVDYQTPWSGYLLSEMPDRNMLQFNLPSFATCFDCDFYDGYPDRYSTKKTDKGYSFTIHGENYSVEY